MSSKDSRTVWSGGKNGDNFKVLPITIIRHEETELGTKSNNYGYVCKI